MSIIDILGIGVSVLLGLGVIIGTGLFLIGAAYLNSMEG